MWKNQLCSWCRPQAGVSDALAANGGAQRCPDPGRGRRHPGHLPERAAPGVQGRRGEPGWELAQRISLVRAAALVQRTVLPHSHQRVFQDSLSSFLCSSAFFLHPSSSPPSVPDCLHALGPHKTLSRCSGVLRSGLQEKLFPLFPQNHVLTGDETTLGLTPDFTSPAHRGSQVCSASMGSRASTECSRSTGHPSGPDRSAQTQRLPALKAFPVIWLPPLRPVAGKWLLLPFTLAGSGSGGGRIVPVRGNRRMDDRNKDKSLFRFTRSGR